MPPDAMTSDETFSNDDRRFMELALQRAEHAGDRGEVPVGAVVVQRGRILAARGNEREFRNDPTAHAEILALRDAATVLGGWRVPEATLYVTVEPCPMCAGALLMARIDRLVYGAADAKGGAAGSVVDLLNRPEFNHRVQVEGGLMAEEATALMRRFFEERRQSDEDTDGSPGEEPNGIPDPNPDENLVENLDENLDENPREDPDTTTRPREEKHG